MKKSDAGDPHGHRLLIREQLARARRYDQDKRRAAEDDEVDEPEYDSRLRHCCP